MSSGNDAQSANETRESVQQYYGTTLQKSSDLKTNACCTAKRPPDYIKDCLNNLHDTTLAKYYGCGLCLPQYDLTGCHILDLGCGAGRDVYLASQLVGPTGKVVGVDMTEEQLASAREFQAYHAEKFGFANTAFYKGYLESLSEIPELEQGSFDVIISNCVINLCTDKAAVLKACYDLLKPGGELYFSDVYANRRIPVALQKDQVLWGECLSGALYWNDFLHLARRAGFTDPRLVEDAPITVQNKEVSAAIENAGQGGLEFYSATYRLFKMEELEPSSEDFGLAIIYKGTIPRAPSRWKLDKKNIFETGKVYPVGGNTFNMCKLNPQLAPHFEFIGNFDTHYGIKIGCMPFDKKSGSSGSTKGSCC